MNRKRSGIEGYRKRSGPRSDADFPNELRPPKAAGGHGADEETQPPLTAEVFSGFNREKVSHDRIPGCGTAGRLQAEFLTTLLGTYDMENFRSYEHKQNFLDCCFDVIDALADEPFDPDRLSWRAMRLLKEKHGLNAPTGWVRARRELCASLKSGRAEKRVDEEVEDGLRETAAGKFLPPVPENVLTSPLSAMGTGLLRGHDALAREAERNPALLSALVETAQKLGVPQSWDEALPYAESVVAQIEKMGDPVPGALLAIRDELTTRLVQPG